MVVLSKKVFDVLNAMVTAFSIDEYVDILGEFEVVNQDVPASDLFEMLNGCRDVTVVRDPVSEEGFLVYYGSETKCLKHLDLVGKKMVKKFRDLL